MISRYRQGSGASPPTGITSRLRVWQCLPIAILRQTSVPSESTYQSQCIGNVRFARWRQIHSQGNWARRQDRFGARQDHDAPARLLIPASSAFSASASDTADNGECPLWVRVVIRPNLPNVRLAPKADIRRPTPAALACSIYGRGIGASSASCTSRSASDGSRKRCNDNCRTASRTFKI